MLNEITFCTFPIYNGAQILQRLIYKLPPRVCILNRCLANKIRESVATVKRANLTVANSVKYAAPFSLCWLAECRQQHMRLHRREKGAWIEHWFTGLGWEQTREGWLKPTRKSNANFIASESEAAQNKLSVSDSSTRHKSDVEVMSTLSDNAGHASRVQTLEPYIFYPHIPNTHENKVRSRNTSFWALFGFHGARFQMR